MAVSLKTLQHHFEIASIQLKALEDSRRSFDEQTSGLSPFRLIRWASDKLSGAKEHQEKFDRSLRRAHQKLEEYRKLNPKDPKNPYQLYNASVLLGDAKRHIKNADRFWSLYHADSSKEAANTANSLFKFSKTGVALLPAGRLARGGASLIEGIAMAGGAHIGVLAFLTPEATPLELSTPEQRTHALVAEAKAALRAWKEGRLGYFDYGNFLIRAETIDRESSEPILKLWNQKIAAYRKIASQTKGDTDQKIKAVVHQTFIESLMVYAVENYNLTDCVEGRGCNCIGDTGLIPCAVNASIPLPPGYQWGIQLYFDQTHRGHGQPIVVKQNEKGMQIWNLKENEEPKKPGRNYHLPIFLHSFLEAMDEDSPVTEQDLLMTEAPYSPSLQRRGSGGGLLSEQGISKTTPTQTPPIPHLSNSPLKFPAGNGHLLPGPWVERAYQRSPYTSVVDSAQRSTDDLIKTIALEEITDPKDNDLKVFKDMGFDFNYRLLPSLNERVLIFKTKTQKFFFNNSFHSPEEEKHFLISLAKLYFAKTLSSQPVLTRTFSLLTTPEKFQDQTLDELEEVQRLLNHLLGSMDWTATAISELYPGGSWYKSYKLNTPLGEYLTPHFHELHPELSRFAKKGINFLNQLKNDPKRFLILMGELPNDKSEKLMHLIDSLRFLFGDPFVKPLAQLIADPKRVVIIKKEEDLEGTIEIKALSKRPVLAQPAPVFPIENKRSINAPQEQFIGISSENMALLIISFGNLNPGLLRRWNSDLSKQYLRRFRIKPSITGGFFLETYKKITSTRPENSRTHPDPFDPTHKVPKDIYEILVEIKKRKENQPTQLPPVIVTP
jgi:hypothetical protein